MLKIYIARHGQDEDNKEGILNGQRDRPLTELGVAQAEKLGETIRQANFVFTAVYSSPLIRAYKTAEVITEKLNLPRPIVLKDLIERDFGVMTGELVKDIEKTCAPDIIKSDPVIYFLKPDRAETFPDLLIRAKRVIEKIKKEHLQGRVLLVTHGDIGKMLYATYYGLEWEEVLKLFHFGNSELLLLAEDSPPEETHIFKDSQENH